MPRQLGVCDHHEGAVLGQDSGEGGVGALIQVIISCWQACLCWIHRVQWWKISEHTGKPKQFTDPLLDDRPHLVSFYPSLPIWVSVFGCPAWDTVTGASLPAFWWCGWWNCLTDDVWILACSQQRPDYEQPSLKPLNLCYFKKTKPKPNQKTRQEPKPKNSESFFWKKDLAVASRVFFAGEKKKSYVFLVSLFKGQNASMLIIMIMKFFRIAVGES